MCIIGHMTSSEKHFSKILYKFFWGLGFFSCSEDEAGVEVQASKLHPSVSTEKQFKVCLY